MLKEQLARRDEQYKSLEQLRDELERTLEEQAKQIAQL